MPAHDGAPLVVVEGSRRRHRYGSAPDLPASVPAPLRHLRCGPKTSAALCGGEGRTSRSSARRRQGRPEARRGAAADLGLPHLKPAELAHCASAAGKGRTPDDLARFRRARRDRRSDSGGARALPTWISLRARSLRLRFATPSGARRWSARQRAFQRYPR